MREQKLERTTAEIAAAVAELLGRMTLEEKLGQMAQSVGADIVAIGSTTMNEPVNDLIRRGLIGSMIQVSPPREMAAKIREFQRIAVEESRLGIPLLFCQDVIHGFETVFPIPLGWSCSFDTDAIRTAAELGAREAACCGINVAFSPMVDLARDPRMGRVAESAGEDPYWGSLVSKALVEGLQGERLGEEYHLAACLKHFIGYCAAEGGRDYNTVELSETTLRNAYLPPFRAGIDAGAAMIMSGFNVINGVPAVANRWLLQDLLREELAFEGVTISDYAAVMELMLHGVARDETEAAEKAIHAGLDIEMTTSYFPRHLAESVAQGRVSVEQVDRAAGRILTLKYRLGLMDDPYRFLKEEEIDRVIFCPEHRAFARKLAADSSVLLKNDGVLPLRRGSKVALIGAFADGEDLCGSWSFSTRRPETPTMAQGLREKGFDVTVELGSLPLEEIEGGIERAAAAARAADVVVLAMGESAVICGEACSRQNITIPQPQQKVAEAVAALGKPTVLVLTNGRPLLLDWYERTVNAILEIWAPGSEAGNAVADLLSGDAEPTGRLTMSFPRHTGQLPLYYNSLPTGRPYVEGSSEHFLSKYIDGRNDACYPFGYGLGYTTFALADLRLSGSSLRRGERVTVSASLRNTGTRVGTTVVQLYLRDCVASISRPVKELKGVQKLTLEAGERIDVSFGIEETQLRFYNAEGALVSEPGLFEVMLGLSSADGDLLRGEFELR